MNPSQNTILANGKRQQLAKDHNTKICHENKVPQASYNTTTTNTPNSQNVLEFSNERQGNFNVSLNHQNNQA